MTLINFAQISKTLFKLESLKLQEILDRQMFSYNKIFMISQKQLNGKKINVQFVNDNSLTAELRGHSTLSYLPFLVSSVVCLMLIYQVIS